jgi:hypothetical protein
MDDSTLTDKLIDSLRMASVAVGTLIVGTATVSVYLQRSMRYFAKAPDIPSMYLPDKSVFQVDVWGLQFGYETLLFYGLLCSEVFAWPPTLSS